jgi:hypothetical protein
MVERSGQKVAERERKWARMVENGEKWSKVVSRPKIGGF